MHRLRPSTQANARDLRAHPTDAERLLWHRLRGHQLGAKFRRQHPIGPHIADFACVEQRLVVELDGGQHNGSERDAERDAWMQAQGWTVLRFWNNDVMKQPDAALEAIAQAIGAAPPPQPSPSAGEGGMP